MLGLSGIEEGHSQPMTAQLLEEHEERGGPIWFFTAKDTDLARALGAGSSRAIAFLVQGPRPVCDRAWRRSRRPTIAPPSIGCGIASSPRGSKAARTIRKLQLLRFEPDRAQVWLNENSALAGVKLLLGRDPKQEYQGKVADVRLDRH